MTDDKANMGSFTYDVIILGGRGQPKVTDGKLYCYFVRKIGKNDDRGGRGSKIPQILMSSYVNDPYLIKYVFLLT